MLCIFNLWIARSELVWGYTAPSECLLNTGFSSCHFFQREVAVLRKHMSIVHGKGCYGQWNYFWGRKFGFCCQYWPTVVPFLSSRSAFAAWAASLLLARLPQHFLEVINWHQNCICWKEMWYPGKIKCLCNSLRPFLKVATGPKSLIFLGCLVWLILRISDLQWKESVLTL